MDKENRKCSIPAKIDEDKGGVTGSVISLKELELLKKRVEKKVLDMAGLLKEGRIAPFPYDHGNRCACDYCDFKAVCFLDKDTVRNRPAIRTQKEILEELDREAENDE